ncbi:hypothetical protein GN244_ATG16920 [Phytophthora infestans]|uniref:Uncharacterized protein n=1 Tax=Phytophthora infestans TaxID=4787 RepID=A0A833S2H7_PHYIN|nr:hypothetical protein GN244_ATG16920 [Phytophthora infestans]
MKYGAFNVADWNCFLKVREALALPAAVAHVDQAGWRYLLAEHCDMDLGAEGQEAFEVHPRPTLCSISFKIS